MKKLFLSAGHGGIYPGTAHHGLVEKNLTLAAVLEAEKILLGYEVEIILARRTDVTFKIADRTKLANSLGVDALISVHINAFTDPAAHGISTYYKDGLGNELAQLLQAEMLAEFGRRDRGIKSDRLWMTHESKMPAALTECMFMSNPTEAEIMKQPDFAKRYGKCIAMGAIKFMGLQKRGDDAVTPHVIVQPGESMYRISKNADVPLADLVKWNQHVTDATLVHPGDMIYLAQPNGLEADYAGLTRELITVKKVDEDALAEKDKIIKGWQDDYNSLMSDAKVAGNALKKYV